jgi:L-glyceraldehyde 3-phosphate reductase
LILREGDAKQDGVNTQASSTRYDSMVYRRSGKSGIRLPAVSLGLWHNFGGVDVFENSRAMVRRAFDLGITHFDLANNYGPPPGSAEETFGNILRKDLRPHRDELIISSKAGWDMWPGPYGNWGSRKYLVASLDQSLARMGLEYVDIFYHHRPDPETPVEFLGMELGLKPGSSTYGLTIPQKQIDKIKEHFTRPCGQTGSGARAAGEAWAARQPRGDGGDDLLC